MKNARFHLRYSLFRLELMFVTCTWFGSCSVVGLSCLSGGLHEMDLFFFFSFSFDKTTCTRPATAAACLPSGYKIDIQSQKRIWLREKDEGVLSEMNFQRDLLKAAGAYFFS